VVALVALSVSTADAIALLALLIALSAAAVALWQARVTVASESWRLQPVVVVYESAAMPDDPASEEPLVSMVYLSNDGPGTAFNVTFGIKVGDHRDAYRPRASTLDRTGDFPRVIPGGGRAPLDEHDSYEIEVPPRLRSQIEARFYWCEYEDAIGRSWRTRNWWDADDGLSIDLLGGGGWRRRLRAARRKAD
jgi:hypothetical protein